MGDSWAFLTVQVPRRLSAEYYPKFPPVLVEASDAITVSEMRANGRPARVPAGVVTLKASAKGGRPAVATLELRHGESRTYRFTERQLFTSMPRHLSLTGTDAALRGCSGAFFMRFLEGSKRRPVRLSHVISPTVDNGLLVTFSGEPRSPLIAEVVVPGRPRVLISLGTTVGPGVGYTTARLTVDGQSSTATLSGDQAQPDLRAAREFVSIGNTTEAMRLISPYLDRYRHEVLHDDMEAVGVAYILIRSAQTASLFPWALELWRSGRLAADGLIIAAEWFGQAGCHLTALNLLREMSETGLPLFTDGYSLAVARLAAYASTDPEHRNGSRRPPPDRRPVFAKKPEVMSRAYELGQYLRDWDRKQARAAHQRMRRGIAQVDWSAYLVRQSLRPKFDLPRPVLTPFDWLETRLMPNWTRIAWRVNRVPQMKDNERSTT